MRKSTEQSPTGFSTWTVIVPNIYINDLSKSVSDKSSPMLFADHTSFITANRNETELKFKTSEIFNEINGFIAIY
jgi:hypothetical protein